MDKSTIVSVTNRDNGVVGYTVPDLGIRRIYQPQETKDVTFEELLKLSYLPGGNTILKENLIIHSDEAIKSLFGEVEPEYYYTEEDIKKLLTVGSLEQLEDCLDFAPEGVKDIVKDLAIKMQINDISKREAIHKATGLDISKAIEIDKQSQDSDDEGAAADKTSTKTRRAAPINEERKIKVIEKK